MRTRRKTQLEIMKFYQRKENRKAERQQSKKEKPRGLLGKLLRK